MPNDFSSFAFASKVGYPLSLLLPMANDGIKVGERPPYQALQMGHKALAKRSKRIFYPRRDLRIHLSTDQAIGFQYFQRIGQDLWRYVWYGFSKPIKTYRFLFCKHTHDEYGPLTRKARDHVPYGASIYVSKFFHTSFIFHLVHIQHCVLLGKYLTIS